MAKSIADVEDYIRYATPRGTDTDYDSLHSLFESKGGQQANLVDLACSAGRHAIETAKRCFEVTGSDSFVDRIANREAPVAKSDQLNWVFFVGDIGDPSVAQKFKFVLSGQQRIS